MKLRKLELRDAPYMLEWMKDETVTKHFNYNFSKMNLEDCLQFIHNADNDEKTLHYAICNNEDQYIGTVSLKNIDNKNRNAEYAIVVSKNAMGTGVAREATDSILRIAFEELNLNKVYLCVSENNKRAISFYKKYGMNQEAVFKRHIFQDEQYYDLLWFSYYRN